MKRIILLPILCIFMHLNLTANPKSSNNNEINQSYLEKVRLIYYTAVENENYIDSLNSLITRKFGNDTSDYPSIALAYRAGVEALKSKHAFWPFNKMSYLNDSMDLFEKAVAEEPMNLEIRFMRFSILYYVPGILGYDEEEENDLEVVYDLLLNKDFSTVDYELQEGMAEFLIDSELLTQSEEEALTTRFTLATNE